jgi:hypothetical protein
MPAEVVHRGRLQPEMVRSFYLDPVHADVRRRLPAGGAYVTGDDGGLVDVRAAVARVQPEQRQQLEQVDVLADGDFLPGRRFPPLDRHRELLPPGGQLVELIPHRRLLRQAKHQGVVGPRAVDVEGNRRVLVPVDVVEQERRRGGPVQVGGRAPGGAQVGFRPHRPGDPQQLVLAFQHPQEAAQVVIRRRHEDLLPPLRPSDKDPCTE